MEKVDNKEHLYYGLYAFAGFGLEILLGMLENMIGIEKNLFFSCLHWSLTCVLWGTVAYLLVRNSDRKLGYAVLEDKKKPSKKNIAAVVLVMAVALIAKYMVIGGFKMIGEIAGLGVVQSVFQYIYYLFETALIVLAVAFGQRFFENLTNCKVVPFGGIFLGCTWGLVHVLTQDFMTGIYAVVSAIVYGVIYVLLNKNIRWSYLLILILFII